MRTSLVSPINNVESWYIVVVAKARRTGESGVFWSAGYELGRRVQEMASEGGENAVVNKLQAIIEFAEDVDAEHEALLAWLQANISNYVALIPGHELAPFLTGFAEGVADNY